MGAVCPIEYPQRGSSGEGFWCPEPSLPEEYTGKDFEADFKTEIAFDGCELVKIAVVVIVTTDPGVNREVPCPFFVTLAGNFGIFCHHCQKNILGKTLRQTSKLKLHLMDVN